MIFICFSVNFSSDFLLLRDDNVKVHSLELFKLHETSIKKSFISGIFMTETLSITVAKKDNSL